MSKSNKYGRLYAVLFPWGGKPYVEHTRFSQTIPCEEALNKRVNRGELITFGRVGTEEEAEEYLANFYATARSLV